MRKVRRMKSREVASWLEDIQQYLGLHGYYWTVKGKDLDKVTFCVVEALLGLAWNLVRPLARDNKWADDLEGLLRAGVSLANRARKEA